MKLFKILLLSLFMAAQIQGESPEILWATSDIPEKESDDRPFLSSPNTKYFLIGAGCFLIVGTALLVVGLRRRIHIPELGLPNGS